jgi:hypothetical protein
MAEQMSILKGCKNGLFSGTPAGCVDARSRSGGLRFAATSGYCLSTLRVVIPLSLPYMTFRARHFGIGVREDQEGWRSIRESVHRVHRQGCRFGGRAWRTCFHKKSCRAQSARTRAASSLRTFDRRVERFERIFALLKSPLKGQMANYRCQLSRFDNSHQARVRVAQSQRCDGPCSLLRALLRV